MAIIDRFEIGSTEYEFQDQKSHNLAAQYSTLATYAVGDYCIYNGDLYKCSTAITTAEAWTAAHWTAAQIAPDLTSQSEKIETVKNTTNKLLDDIKEGYKSVTFTVTNNKRAGIYNGVVEIKDATNALNCLSADVVYGQIISISCRAGYAFPTYVFADASGNGIIQVNVTDGSTPQNLSYYDVVVPYGATKMYVNGSYIYPIYVYENVGSVQRTNTLVKNLVSGVNIPNTAVTTTKTTSTRFSIDTYGFITTSSITGIDLYVADCTPLGVYYVTGRFNPYQLNIRFADDYDYVVGSVNINEGGASATEVTDYQIVAPEKAKKIYINISNISTLTLKSGAIPSFDLFPNVVTVGKSGDVDFGTINSAVQASADGSTILVFPGTYEEQVSAWGKTVNIIGIDKNTCIIKDSSSDYRTPPVEIGSGSLQNLTIIEDHADPDDSLLTGDDTDGHDWNYQRAYSIHIEDYTAVEKELLISNCIIKNTLRAAIGCGLYDEQKVRIENCYIWSGTPTRTVDIRRGALYAHNYDGSAQSLGTNADDQILQIVACQIECTDSLTMVILDAGASGATSLMYITAINNMLYSDISGKADSIVSFTKSHETNDNITITGKSYGNNVSVLND